MTSDMSIHEPALTRQEAAMLPAIGSSGFSRMLRPERKTDFIPIDFTFADMAGAFARHGCSAGRAVLHSPGVSLPGPEGMRRGCRSRGTPVRPIPPEPEEQPEAAPMIIRPEGNAMQAVAANPK